MDVWQAFTVAMKIAPRLMGQQGNPIPKQGTTTILTEKDTALISLRQKMGSVTVVVGSRETGKSVLCWRLAEFLERPTYAVSPQEKPPGWITWIQNPTDLFEIVKPDSTLICDDLPAYASNRDYNEAMVRMIEKAIPMVRHDPQPPEYPLGRVHIIFSTQSTAQADKYILDCDMAFFKPLGLLLQDTERPAIAKMYRTMIDPEFEGKDDMFIKQHAYMLSRTYKGLITIKKSA